MTFFLFFFYYAQSVFVTNTRTSGDRFGGGKGLILFLTSWVRFSKLTLNKHYSFFFFKTKLIMGLFIKSYNINWCTPGSKIYLTINNNNNNHAQVWAENTVNCSTRGFVIFFIRQPFQPKILSIQVKSSDIFYNIF